MRSSRTCLWERLVPEPEVPAVGRELPFEGGTGSAGGSCTKAEVSEVGCRVGRGRTVGASGIAVESCTGSDAEGRALYGKGSTAYSGRDLRDLDLQIRNVVSSPMAQMAPTAPPAIAAMSADLDFASLDVWSAAVVELVELAKLGGGTMIVVLGTL